MLFVLNFSQSLFFYVVKLFTNNLSLFWIFKIFWFLFDDSIYDGSTYDDIIYDDSTFDDSIYYDIIYDDNTYDGIIYDDII
jgi:hypothetical protein